MLRNFLVFAARTVVENGLVSMVGWRCSGQLQNWGLVVEKWGSHAKPAYCTGVRVCGADYSLVFAKNTSVSRMFGESSSKISAGGGILSKDERVLKYLYSHRVFGIRLLQKCRPVCQMYDGVNIKGGKQPIVTG